MKVRIDKPIVGYRRVDNETAGAYSSQFTYANPGDVLTVILHNKTHYICDVEEFPNFPIVVFPSQCSEIIPERSQIDEHAEEKYYQVYQDQTPENDDPFYSALFEPVFE